MSQNQPPRDEDDQTVELPPTGPTQVPQAAGHDDNPDADDPAERLNRLEHGVWHAPRGPIVRLAAACILLMVFAGIIATIIMIIVGPPDTYMNPDADAGTLDSTTVQPNDAQPTDAPPTNTPSADPADHTNNDTNHDTNPSASP